MIKEIAKQLKTRFSEMGIEAPLEEIESKLGALINEYRVPVDEAKRSVVNQYLRKSDIPRNEFYVRSESDFVKIRDIQSEGRWVSLKAKVVQLWSSESESIAQVGLIGDDTGTIKFVNWAKSNCTMVEEDRNYVFKNVVTDSWQGRFQVNFNKNTEIQGIEEEIEVGSLVEEIMGVIIDIQSGSGLIKRCESCNRALVKGSCGEHGKVEGKYDLRVKAIIDDGKIVQDALLNRDAIETLTGITLDRARKMAAEALDSSVVLDALADKLIGRYFKVQGPKIGRYMLVEEIQKMSMASNDDVKELIAQVEAI
ncbi:MAG: replication factor A [Methanosarcinales archaeon Met12]|nr:MAG: replication factor A [Methanosarcinales archaeon Met12]